MSVFVCGSFEMGGGRAFELYRSAKSISHATLCVSGLMDKTTESDTALNALLRSMMKHGFFQVSLCHRIQ